MKQFTSPDGIRWGVEVVVPGASNALVMFRHPDGRTARLDRYGWYIGHGPESKSVTARLDAKKVLAALDDEILTRLFRRAIPVSRSTSPFNELLNPATGRTA